MIEIVDRTSNTTFFPSTNPLHIGFRTNANNTDFFTIPYGVPERVLGINAEDDNNVIASASVSGGTITIGLVSDSGGTSEADTDLIGEVILRSQ